MNKRTWIDGMMGLVIGDACGVPVEFCSREDLKKNPVTNMRKYGTHNQPRGTWSDDSSMALANLASLHKGYHLANIAVQFQRWAQEENYTPFGEVFDIGTTCSRAIQNFTDSGDPRTCGLTGENDNGNGSLMRILPMCIYAYGLETEGNTSEEDAVSMIHEVSALTHAHLRSKMACGLYYFCVKSILENRDARSLSNCLQSGLDKGFSYYQMESVNLPEVSRYSRLVDMKEFVKADENTIRTTGYVLDTLEAAIWCLLNTKSYEEAILKVVNQGDDTDTVGAIAGGLAGLYYGYDSIPKEWRDCIVKKEWILELCDFEQIKAEVFDGPAVDNHSHVLPGMDDGAADMEISIDMLRMAEKEGVTELFVTPHGDYVCERIEYYHETFDKLVSQAKERNISINLYKGCEVFCELTSEDGANDKDDITYILNGLNERLYPTYNDTKYVLIEFNPLIQIAEALIIVNGLIEADYIPVFAHMERYPFLIKEKYIDAFVALGCKIQINMYSLIDDSVDVFKKGARYLLGRGAVSFLGSDAHGNHRRAPRLKQGIQYIWENCCEEYAKDVIYRNAYKYLIEGCLSK